MIEKAAACHRHGLAHRHVGKLIDVERPAIDPFVWVGIALRLRSPDLGERLLAAADSAVKDDTGVRAQGLAHQLAFGAPALGIWWREGVSRPRSGRRRCCST